MPNPADLIGMAALERREKGEEAEAEAREKALLGLEVVSSAPARVSLFSAGGTGVLRCVPSCQHLILRCGVVVITGAMEMRLVCCELEVVCGGGIAGVDWRASGRADFTCFRERPPAAGRCSLIDTSRPSDVATSTFNVG